MKICPQCQTKYTDDTLKFCLQDGKPLEFVGDDKTLVIDQNSFANDETIADNFFGNTQGYSGETVAFENKETNADQKATDNKINIAIDSSESATIPRPRKLTQTPPTVDPIQPTEKKGRFGLLTGFILAIIILGFAGVAILAVVFLPSMLGGGNSNITNTNSEKIEKDKERVLSDVSEVKLSASSSRKQESGNFYYPKMAFDGNSRTAWCEGAKGPGKGQWIAFDFDKEVTLKKIIIEPGYFKTEELWSKNNRLKVANLKFSDGTKKSVTFPNEMKEQTINTKDIKTKSVMITIRDYYPGSADIKDTLISEVKFVVEDKD